MALPISGIIDSVGPDDDTGFVEIRCRVLVTDLDAVQEFIDEETVITIKEKK